MLKVSYKTVCKRLFNLPSFESIFVEDISSYIYMV